MGANDWVCVPRQLRLSPAQFDLAWRDLGLGRQPAALRGPEPGLSAPEQAARDRDTGRQLELDGLGRPGRLDPHLVSLLLVLANAQRVIDAALSFEPSKQALAVARGDAGVLAVRDPEGIVLRTAHREALPRLVVSAAPPLRGGTGRSVSLSSAVFDEACSQGMGTAEQLEQALLQLRVRPDDARTIGHMLSGVVGGGQFGAAMRDAHGRWHRATHTIAFFDTARGRYLLEQRGTYDGSSWTTISPGTPARLTAQVQRLMADLSSTTGGS